MSKITISSFIENSRIVSKNLGRYTLAPTQASDIIITKKGNASYFIVYLPLDYHIKNPLYLGQKLQGVSQEAKDGRIWVIVLNEENDNVKRIGDVQSTCLKKNINLMVCFDID
jgi:hypothetical protein